VLLLVGAVAGLIWANLPDTDSYTDFWHAHIALDFNIVEIDLSLKHWVNDGLMAIFFFVVGLEIKRELLRGELAEPRKAALPVAAALGGMVVPALIYTALNFGGDGERGWGIPMATDIAFAVGVMALLGARAPLSLKVFLLALAIVDDLGAIAVIAIFYTEQIEFGWLALAVGLFALTAILGQIGVRDLVVYAAIALVAWLAVHESGVHATIAGVMLGLLTPVKAVYERREVELKVLALAEDLRRGDESATVEGDELQQSALRELEEVARETQPVLDRLEHALHPWTSYLIIPTFALANAGVVLNADVVSDAASSPISWGVALGLVIGKPLGIVLFSFAAVRLGVATLPAGVRWLRLTGAGILAGIGFTVSLFIADLAFTSEELIDEAKIGILAGSALMGVAGYALLRALPPEREANERAPAVRDLSASAVSEG